MSDLIRDNYKHILAMILVNGVFMLNSYAATDAPDPIGNFSLPPSQRPGAFFSYGSNIINPGQVQGRVTPNTLKARGQRYIGSSLYLLYGTSATTSLLFSLPITPSATVASHHFAGIGDMGLQGEYAFYKRASTYDTEQAAMLAGFSVPSGARGLSYQTSSYFLGATYNHMLVDWIWFAAPGVLLFGGNQNNRLKPCYFYEAGVGRNISSQSGQHIFTWFLEVNGQSGQSNASVIEKARSGQELIPSGTLLYFSPSLWFSSQKWIIRAGLSLPIEQHWSNPRIRTDYYAITSITYTFN